MDTLNRRPERHRQPCVCRRIRVMALAVAVIALSPQASTQPAGDPQPRPTFRVEANLVRVDAIVTKDGEPVRDLTAADFEVLEDGVRQEIASFERVDITESRLTRAPGRDPSSAAEARAMAEDPRARLFVLFLDRYHTGVAGSHRMQSALGTLLDRIIGPDDLVAVMTPDMSATDITFTRRTASISEMLRANWTWGVRDQIAALDPVEQDYLLCFPDSAPQPERGASPAGMLEGGAVPTSTVAREMIARRREKRTLDAMTDLAVFLRGVREERKAVIVVSDGWTLFRPNEALLRLGGQERLPGLGRPGTDPSGRVVPDARAASSQSSRQYQCDADRQRLAYLDNRQTYLDLLDYANRGNVSFYPIDSRGLPVFDTSMADPLPPSIDQRILRDRITTLQTLAENTDGLAVVNRNDIERGLERVVADLSSYYLLSYYATNTALDGKFRKITVRVKRPGVTVRARRGYRAATPEEMSGASLNATAAAPAAAVAPALQAAFGALAGSRGDARLRTSAGLWRGEGGAARLWVLAELDAALTRSADWTAGGSVQVALVAADGAPVAATTARIDPGARVVSVDLAPESLADGEYVVRARATPADGGLPLADMVRVVWPPAGSDFGQPRMSRRGPTTGLAYVPSADTRFRRTERVRFEWAARPGACTRRAEIVDQRGQPMAIPVTAILGACDAAQASGALGVEIALAPFAAADYGVRVVLWDGTTEHESFAAFRIVP